MKLSFSLPKLFDFDWRQAFLPNGVIPRPSKVGIGMLYGLVLLLAWQYLDIGIWPHPASVWDALMVLFHQGLKKHIAMSLLTNAEAVGCSALISFSVAYASTIPVLRPIGQMLAKLRFLGIVGPLFLFMYIFGAGHELKVVVLTFGMSSYLITDMCKVVVSVPQSLYNYSYTLGMNRFRAVWDTVILGTLDRALEALGTSAAMGWMMLTSIEGVVRSERGIGILLNDNTRHQDLSTIGALILVILTVGFAQDLLISFIRNLVCPYVKYEKARS